MELIDKYEFSLNPEQRSQLVQLKPLYEDWNAKINVISRKDMDEFYTHHVLHSLSIVRLNRINAGEVVLDVGTGGGFPGIPLAIFYPETQFILVDSIGKKIRVVEAVAHALGLKNVTAIHSRMEDLQLSVDHIVSRAVAPAIKLVGFTKKHLRYTGDYIFIKGGELFEEEIDVMHSYPTARWKEHAISEWFKEPFFETKKLVTLDFK